MLSDRTMTMALGWGVFSPSPKPSMATFWRGRLPEITQSQFAKSIGVSQAHISRLVKKGIIKRSGGGIDSDQANEAMSATRVLHRKQRRKASGPNGHSQEPLGPPPSQADALVSFTEAQRRLENWKAKREELNFKKLAGELVESAAVERHWKERFISCKAKLLGIPRKSIPLVRTAATDGEAEAILLAVICEVLEGLSGSGTPRNRRKLKPSVYSGVETSPKAHGKPVGRPKKKAQSRKRSRSQGV